MRSPVFTFLTGLLLLPLWSFAQINDCSGAEVVCDNGHLASNPQGPGFDDFADPDNFPGCITSLELNSAWYYFEIDPAAPPDLILGFIIHPDGGLGEDYDWALFGPDVVCGDLGSPIRCSSSSATCGFCPETGMGMGTTDFTEGPGTGDGFVMTLVVQPGQGFYLLIDNWLGTSNGFVLEWTDTAAEYLNCAAQPPCALEAAAGADISACEGDIVGLNGGSTGGHGNVTYSWTGTNGGTSFLNNPNIANPIITLPNGFIGSIIYTLTVTEDTCTGMDDLELEVNSLPVININQIGPFCPEQPPQTLTATPPGGTWSGDVTGNTFSPTTNGPGIHTVTYTYTDVNGCSATESMDIEVHEGPDVTIDPVPAEFCDSENSILLTSTGSGGAGGFTYMWTTPGGPADGNTYEAMDQGIYTVTVTDDNGCIHSTSIIVTIHPNPDVEINDPGLICASTVSMTITADPPGGIFDGSIIAPDGEINPDIVAPGTYWITYSYTDNHNCEGSAGLSITIIPVPESLPDNNSPFCEGQPILLTGATNATGSDISYIWSGPDGYTSNVQNPVDATLAGNYTLQVIVDGCPSEFAVTTVYLIDQPDAYASNQGPYCSGDTIQLLGSTNASGNIITYAWTGPNGYTSDLQNPADAQVAGIYSLVITVDGCPSAVAQTDVVFGNPTDATASNTGPYCQGDSIFLTGNTSITGNVITYAWTGPNGYQSSAQNPLDASEPGLYQLIIDVDGCQSSIVTTDVMINSNPQPLITGPNTFCTGFSSTLDAGAGYSFYTWNNGSQNQMLEVFTSGTYHVTVTDANGCTGESSIGVTENSSLSPVITGLLAFCEGAGTILDAGSGYVSYVWSDGQTNQTISVTSGGNYGVIVTDADGCTGSANITAIENANPNVMIGGSTTYCIGGSTVLDAGSGYATYLWSNSSANQTILVSSPGIFTVDVVDTNGCTGSDSVTVDESTSLSPVITGNDKFCENGSTTLNAGTGFATYLWSDGSINQLLNVSAAGNYSVTVSDGQGCSGEAVVMVSEISPPVTQVSPSATLCNTVAGGSMINLYDQLISGDINGSWQDVDNSGAVGLFTNLNFNGIPAGNYHFIYTTNSAIDPCPETSYQVILTILDCACPDVLFFNAGPLCNSGTILNLMTIENTTEPGNWTILQTPPGSNPAVLIGGNVIFDPAGRDPGDYVLQFTLQNMPPSGCLLIFDRWGNVLHEATNFSPNDVSKGWDGHFKNVSLNTGVFTYVAEIEYIDGVSEIIAGDVTLIR